MALYSSYDIILWCGVIGLIFFMKEHEMGQL